MSSSVRVLHYGLGPIGIGIARLVARRPGLRSVGAVDINPAKAGRDLADLLGLSPGPEGRVETSLQAALAAAQPDVVVHATGSRLVSILPQFVELANAGLPVVSTCEELSYPWFHHPREAQAIDAAARAVGVSILSTGINPGFIMDSLAVVLSGVCTGVHSIRVRRVVDLSVRRVQLQQKVGVGLTPAAFASLRAEGRLGHVGLPESVAMISAALGWKLDEVQQVLEPVIAEALLPSALGPVPAGRVQGQHQVARGIVAGGERITLTLTMALHAPDAGDYAELQGEQTVSSALHGINGDVATAALIVNAIPRVLSAGPGLRTMLEIPPLCSRGV
jgi:hypothetical protein